MPDLVPLLNTIRQTYPHLAIDSVQLNREGQYNDVLIVNDEWVFRFAKFAEGIDTLRRELVILSRIQEQITLAIPHPLFQSVDTETVGKAFIGYRLLPGQPLWLENYQTIQDEAARVRMAHQVAGFLRELHAIPVAQTIPLDLPLADQPEEWRDLYRRIQDNLFSHMHARARAQVSHHFESYFANLQPYHFDPVLRHGDFGSGNLLYNPTTQVITAVLDFGATTLGDPAIDFAGLFSFGEDFCRHCYAVYPELAAMRERARFYRGTFALQEALYGAETGDVEAFARGMEGYR